MSDKGSIKEEIQESLINNFIENKIVVEKEMNLLNILISSFGGSEYTYDEYCGKRLEFEASACDKVVDVDVDKELTVSPSDRGVIHVNAVNLMLKNQIGYEEALQEEYIKWQIQKCYNIDKNMFYQISKFSSMMLLKNKIPEDTWQLKHGYFVDICEDKAKRYGIATADANKDRHEQDIRSSMV